MLLMSNPLNASVKHQFGQANCYITLGVPIARRHCAETIGLRALEHTEQIALDRPVCRNVDPLSEQKPIRNIVSGSDHGYMALTQLML